MGISVTELVQDITGLVSFPVVGLRVNELVNDPTSTAAQLGDVISRDPGLTAQVLQIANSAAFGHSSQIETVSRAVTVIGTRMIRDIVLASSTVHAFEGIPNELVSMENFWRHSLYCGLAARFLAAEHRIRNTETLFVAGMLHDIGQLVIFRKLPQESKQALLLSIEGDEDFALHHAEQKVLGFDHAQVGAALLRRWNFPTLLVECTEFHHDPAQARQFPVEAAIVHIANSIAQLAEVDSVQEDDALLTDPAAWKTAGIDKDIIEPAVRAAQSQFADVQKMFM
ncbi:MAG: HDOD domain-containing protein [Gammaproteobacteria bacterium]|nr:HDOD domain-containing protein [Gammaproteobacteria bacterium]